MTGPASESGVYAKGQLGVAKDLYPPGELKELIILTRLSRYNRGVPCGAKAIRQELDSLDIRPLPSESFIGQVLREEGLTYCRTGNY